MSTEIADPTRTRRARLGAALLAGALAGALASSGLALANDAAAAEILFRQGKALLEANQLPEACAKLAESQRLDPSSGTLLNLAHCHEKQGKIATAWAEFLAASRLARSQKNEAREAEAQARARALEPRLSHVIIKAARPVDGMTLRRDDVDLALASLGEKLPVDPGKHTLTARAPGHEPWSQALDVAGEQLLLTVVIPPLKPLAAEAPSAAASSASSPAASSTSSASSPPASSASSALPPTTPGARRTAGLVLGGAGLAAAVVGGVFGLRAISTYDDASKLCPTHRQCSPDAMSTRKDASSQALVANVGAGAGLLLLGVGGYLLLTAPSASVGLAPRLGPGHLGGAIHGRF